MHIKAKLDGVAVQFTLRPALDDDLAFAFDAKRNAMGAHIAARWGWDEKLQLEHHRSRWASKPWKIITLGTTPVGTVSINWEPTHMQFGEFYILDTYRNRGLGAQVLTNAVTEADQKRVETKLEYLKWNPVASLYARHGFKVVGESETHYYLARLPIET